MMLLPVLCSYIKKASWSGGFFVRLRILALTTNRLPNQGKVKKNTKKNSLFIMFTRLVMKISRF
ncbi:hypothetical protein D5074_00200 [Pectobacterium polaris]|nr:hypothetical protein BJJ97_20980 [Pectobacterium polaris]RJL31511.1 hypothetical protein D5074_00200 [Pectobacterium polaris]